MSSSRRFELASSSTRRRRASRSAHRHGGSVFFLAKHHLQAGIQQIAYLFWVVDARYLAGNPRDFIRSRSNRSGRLGARGADPSLALRPLFGFGVQRFPQRHRTSRTGGAAAKRAGVAAQFTHDVKNITRAFGRRQYDAKRIRGKKCYGTHQLSTLSTFTMRAGATRKKRDEFLYNPFRAIPNCVSAMSTGRYGPTRTHYSWQRNRRSVLLRRLLARMANPRPQTRGATSSAAETTHPHVSSEAQAGSRDIASARFSLPRL